MYQCKKNNAIFFLLLMSIPAWVYAIDLYPEGVCNPRIPIVLPAKMKTIGHYMHLNNIDFTYTLSPHIRNTRSGVAEFFVKDIRKRGQRDIVVLFEKHSGRKVSITIPDAPAGKRHLMLSAVDSRMSPEILSENAWQKVTLNWGNGKICLKGEALPTSGLTTVLPPDFTPDALTIRSPYIDNFSMTVSDGIFILDWEKEYKGTLITKNSKGAKTIRLFGFDNYIIGQNPSKRDAAMVYFVNTTESPAEMTVSFRVYREIANLTSHFSIKDIIPPGKTVMKSIVFPYNWSSDICHLYAASSDTTEPFSEEKHFMTLELRNEAKGPGLFGIHDSNCTSFGWWPDALPIRYTHKYLRWSFVMGPNYIKAKNPHPSLDPSAPPDEWCWDDDIDWSIAAGREIYLSIQSYPTSSWYRSHEFSRGMRIYPHGERGGGMPDLKKYNKFIRATAQYYKNRIHLYEIENEPMAYGFRHNPKAYAKVAKIAVRELKKADPNNFIYGICGTSYFLDWMNIVTKAGITQLFDGFSIHTYTSPRMPDEVDLDKRIREHRNAFPGQNKPMFNSETGINTAYRYDIEKPISPKIVAANAAARKPGFHSKKSWPGPVADEYSASSALVSNAVINFLEGARAFVFFMWNDIKTPEKGTPWNTRLGQFYRLIVHTPDLRFTPALPMLAGAVMTTQMEGVIPEKNFQKAEAGNLRGGIFSKVNGGKVAVLWAKAPKESVLIRSSESLLEFVSIYGQKRVLKPKSRSGKFYLYVLQIGKTPFYIHSRKNDLKVLPSPISNVFVENLMNGKGLITLEILNVYEKEWIPKIVPQPIKGLNVTASGIPPVIPRKRHGKIDFFCTATNCKDNYWVTFNLNLPDGEYFSHSVHILAKPNMNVARVDKDFSIKNPNSLDAIAHPFRINTEKQCKEGRPPQMLSFHDPNFWNGETELSAEARLALSPEKLFVLIKVRDSQPRLPEVWPGVLGSVPEVFLDFRSKAEGLGKRSYAKGVFQIIFQPLFSKDGTPIWFSKQLKDDGRIRSIGGPLPGVGYWIGMEIPLKLLSPRKALPKQFGVDFAINGPFTDRPGRKTQMIGFGGADSWRNAKNFGTALVEKNKSNKLRIQNSQLMKKK